MCHQSVGLVQREIESRGIRTATIMHVPNLAERIRPPRIYEVDAPLGETFSKPYDIKMHQQITKELIEFAAYGGPEEHYVSPYVWDERHGLVLPDENHSEVEDDN